MEQNTGRYYMLGTCSSHLLFDQDGPIGSSLVGDDRSGWNNLDPYQKWTNASITM